MYFATWSKGNIEVYAERWIAQDLFDGCRMILHGPDEPAHSGMCPDNDRPRIPLKYRFRLIEVSRLTPLRCKWNVRIVVDDNHQPDLVGTIEDPVESGILKTCDFAGDLGGDELFMY